MSDVWLGVVDTILRPARKDLAFCLGERELHLERRKRLNDERMRALKDVEQRIESARSLVFAASDGVVRMNMTDLEREWRHLSKRDPDAGLMDLWARITPTSWHDQKKWRDSPAASRVDAAVALGSDIAGVEAAEEAVVALRAALREGGATIGARTSWRFFDHDRGFSPGFLRAAGIMSPRERRDVHDAMLARFPDRPLLARDVALVAAEKSSLPVVKALRALWRTGYVLSQVDPEGIALEMPALPT